MPCMGPGVNPEQIEKAYNDVLVLLKEKYKIFACPPLYPKLFELSHEKALEKLKKSIYKVFLQDASEGF